MGAFLKSCVLFSCLLSAVAFPVAELSVTSTQFTQLTNASSETARSALATSLILPHLRVYFNQTAHAIEVNTSDVTKAYSLPSQTVDNSCSHTITAENPHGSATLLHGSKLDFGVSYINWHGAQVFADAEVDVALGIDSNIKVEVGKHVFGHHCTHLGGKTVGVNVKSHGTNGLGLNFTASNATIEKSPTGTGYDLVFNFHADVVTLVIKWDVDDIKVNNCKIKILGVTIASYCGFLAKEIKNGANKLSEQVTRVTAPKLAEKLEAAINTKIGSVVRIPLKL